MQYLTHYVLDEDYMNENDFLHACFCPCSSAGKLIKNSKYSNDKINMYFMVVYYVKCLIWYSASNNLEKNVIEFIKLLKYCKNRYGDVIRAVNDIIKQISDIMPSNSNQSQITYINTIKAFK